MSSTQKQNLTVSLSKQTVKKIKVLAARRSTSISGFLAGQIEILVGEEEAYESDRRAALDLMEQGFHLGGKRLVGRDELHER
jgi:GTP:adenosylcobinamide-phosphate guanylyltransferase